MKPFAENSPNRAFTVAATTDKEIYVNHNISQQGSYLPREDAKWLAEAIMRWLDEGGASDGTD